MKKHSLVLLLDIQYYLAMIYYLIDAITSPGIGPDNEQKNKLRYKAAKLGIGLEFFHSDLWDSLEIPKTPAGKLATIPCYTNDEYNMQPQC